MAVDKYGRIIRNTTESVRGIMPSPIQASSPNYRYYGDSWWGNFNYGIASIGQWIQDTGASVVALIITAIPTLLVAFQLLKWNFSVFSDNGFILGALSLFADLFVVGIGYYVFFIVYAVIYAVLFILGYVFYNAYTLIIAIVLGGGIWLWVGLYGVTSQGSTKKYSNSTTVSAPAHTLYYCTASKLNVRTAPASNARVIGTVSRGDIVDVYEFDGNFARIKWGKSTAYVSRKYIKR